MPTKKSAFTLVEILITLSIFAVVAVISVTLMVNALRSARKIQAQVLLYSESEALMDEMAQEVERNTVDYEAYYARDVRGDTGWDTPDYGMYAKSFYNPGTDGPDSGPYAGISGYGAYCSDGSSSYPADCPADTPVASQEDKDTGEHPFDGITGTSAYASVDASSMNAFCETTDSATDCDALQNGVQDNLILVNGNGDSRTVYALKPFSTGTENYLSKMQLDGTDTDDNAVVDDWTCNSRYACDTPAITNFANLSPDSLNIEEFYVIVEPFEDPYRGFAESAEQVQPQITLVMKATLSSEYGSNVLGEPSEILLQRTVSTGVYSKVNSYE